jgi:hypothetical protein
MTVKSFRICVSRLVRPARQGPDGKTTGITLGDTVPDTVACSSQHHCGKVEFNDAAASALQPQSNDAGTDSDLQHGFSEVQQAVKLAGVGMARFSPPLVRS